MRNENFTLRFPTKERSIDPTDVRGVALEANGKIDATNMRKLLLEQFRKMYVLLRPQSQKRFREGDSYFFHNHPVNVMEEALAVSEEHTYFENIGRECGWMPITMIHGSFVIEEIRQMPVESLINNPRIDAPTTVAICELFPEATLHLPEGFTPSDANRTIYVQGQSLRTVDTFPDRPGGGTHLKVA